MLIVGGRIVGDCTLLNSATQIQALGVFLRENREHEIQARNLAVMWNNTLLCIRQGNT